MPETVVILDDRPESARAVAAGLGRQGYRVLSAAAATEALAWVASAGPAAVVVGGAMADDAFVRLLRRIRRRDARVDVLRLVDGTAQDTGGLRRADGVLVRPASEDAWGACLRAAREAAALRRRLRRRRRESGRAVEKRLNERLETERFLTVKQIVDKLSTFIGQIARDVEGGVRYFNDMPYFVAIHDRRGRVLAANRSYRMLLGHNIGDPSWSVYEGGSGSAEQCPVGRTLRTASAQESREILHYRSGAKVPVIVHTAPIYSDDGEVELVLEVSAGTRDVGQMRSELHRTQQRYQAIFDSVPCHVVVLDRHLRVTANNRRFTDEFGDKTGALLRDVLWMDDDAFAASPIRSTQATGRSSHGEMALTGPDGRRYTMLAWTSPMTTAAGKLMQVLVVFLDITEVRSLQSNLAALGLMIASISHSIKGVLTGLDAGVYLLDQGIRKRDDAGVEGGLDIVRRMVERVRRMIMDILFCAKERELKREPVDIRAFAEDLAKTARDLCDAKDIQLVTEVDGGLGVFEVDPGLLRSALVNLLENAVEACAADGSGRPHKVVFHVEAGPDAVGISVEDNGIGMTPEQLKNLFTLFFSTKGSQGTGLGLFIADRIVRRHGGDIAVESSPGLGSRFCIMIPRRAPQASEAGKRPG
jgi:PAS domain S-box-containing protein